MGSRLQTALDTPYGQMTDEQRGLVKEASFLLSDEELAQYPFLAMTAEPSTPPEPLQVPDEAPVVEPPAGPEINGPDAYDPAKDPTKIPGEVEGVELESGVTPDFSVPDSEGDSIETV